MFAAGLAILAAWLMAASGQAADGKQPKTSIPKIASIAKVEIGYSTQADLAKQWGEGKTITGGHANSGRLWRVKGTTWVLQTDGFDYTQRGLVVDSFTLYEDPKWYCCPEAFVSAPDTRLSKKDFVWLGGISPGMSREKVMQFLKRKSLPVTLTPDGCETTAKGFCALTSLPLYPLQTWTATFVFTNGCLGRLQLNAR